jgi:hypothetical protein
MPCLGPGGSRAHGAENALASTLRQELHELVGATDELIAFGERNFLWFRKSPLLLQWRRGVRGLEYGTLSVLMRKISDVAGESLSANPPDRQVFEQVRARLEEIRGPLATFIAGAKLLLLLERHALGNCRITYEQCDDPKIHELRITLFSNAKSHGGLFKEIIGDLDDLLYLLMEKRPYPQDSCGQSTGQGKVLR